LPIKSEPITLTKEQLDRIKENKEKALKRLKETQDKKNNSTNASPSITPTASPKKELVPVQSKTIVDEIPIEMNLKQESGWNEILKEEFKKNYFISLKKFIAEERKTQTIYPPNEKIFNSFNFCTWDNLKVVILGQDPYINPNQAVGLSFSVPKSANIPPSLQNIYKEIKNNYPDYKIPTHGSLENWSKQGILLLNTVLTVRKSSSNSHAGKGWETFTDYVISQIAAKKKSIIFVLWGRNAQDKKKILQKYPSVSFLESAHPSPFSADKFFGNGHFLKINQLLKQFGQAEINWDVDYDPSK